MSSDPPLPQPLRQVHENLRDERNDGPFEPACTGRANGVPLISRSSCPSLTAHVVRLRNARRNEGKHVSWGACAAAATRSLEDVLASGLYNGSDEQPAPLAGWTGFHAATLMPYPG